MANLILCNMGSNKAEVVKLIMISTGLGIGEVKNIVDAVDDGQEQILQNIPNDRFYSILEEFTAAGATVKKLNDFENAIMEEDFFVQEVPMYIPPVDPEMIHKLDRRGTMDVLVEAGKIAKESEQLELEVATLVSRLKENRKRVDELKTALSKKASMKIWLVTLAVGGISCMVFSILGVFIGIITWIIMYMTIGRSDLKQHADANNANANEYFREQVAPLEEELNKVCAKREELFNGGKKSWVISVVGEDMFYSACIGDLYDLVKSHRADNLKEALNLYDDALHKARMEKMQEEIKNTSEVAAKESVKQTALARQTARAARRTAANTREIDRNTRRFR